MSRLVPRIDVAEQSGVGLDGKPRPSEDRVIVTDHAVAVLDGVTEKRPSVRSGGWYAEHLARRIRTALTATPEAGLRAILATAIDGITTDHGLLPGRAPASTVAMARWTPLRVDTLVLGDSPAVALTRSGGADVVADTRLDDLRSAGALTTPAEVARLRNTEGGFWVAEADPRAARAAYCRSWSRHDVAAVLLATDGVSIGVDEYRILDWPDTLALARHRGARSVLDTVRSAERHDPDRLRWPRPKRHDDQALALVDFLA